MKMQTLNSPKAAFYQIIPTEVCFSCDVCCRFLEADSPLAPIFTEVEREKVVTHGADPSVFRSQTDGKSAQIQLKPHENFYICPFFDSETGCCTIYPMRPLDCQLYPFALMFSEDGSEVVLGVDTLCPFAEERFETEIFQRHIRDVVNYVESEEINEQIISNWSLIGEYQDAVRIVHTLRRSDLLIAMLRTS